MDPATASELERHDKLKEKYTQLKQSYNVLKKGLLDKQEECGRLDQQVKEKETRLRQQLEEIDKLQYQNGRMSKQMGTLNSQVEELKQKSQQSSWSVGGLISGKPQQEAMQKAEEEIRVLRDHMETQIQQNEELHMKIFAQDEELQRLRDERSGTAQELDERSSLLEKERQYCGRLKAELREASERGHLLEEELSGSRAALEALQTTLEAERREARRYSSGLEAKLTRWLPFHEAAHEAWNQWNVAPRCGRELHRRSQALQRLHTAAGEACAAGGTLLQLWSRTLAAPSGLAQGQGQGQGQRTQTLTKLADAAQQLSAALRETAPELMGALGPQLRQPRPSAQHLRKSSSALLQAHRSWVLHQSLLLLHDAPSSPGERQKAERLVDSLWHVHRCVRTLVAKLRMLRCVPDIVAQSTSSSHFSLARRALRRGDSAERLQNLGEVPERLLARVAVVLGDAAAAWEGLGRSLSTWAGAQESGLMAELLESLHQFHACLVGRVMPALDQVAADVPQSIGVLAQQSCLALDLPDGCVDSAHSGYLHRAATRLRQACPGIGFDESQQTLLLARRLVAEGSRAKGELRQQVDRLQVVTDEKASLAEELRVLQDRHELLRSNFQVLEQQGAVAAATTLSTNAVTAGGGVRPEATSVPATASTSAGLILNQAVVPPGATAGAGAGAAGVAAGGALLLGAGDLLLSSRQRALLESLSVTAQESSALRQHGFFVDVISLSAGEVGLAGGPPDPAEASEPWELAVRKVYEQHCRGLQAQVRAADGRAVELQLSVQRCADLRRQQEEARRQLQDEVKAGQAQLEGVREDMATTRKNYDQQLAMLTEHICTLSVRLSEKDAGLASLQSQKILCGHCGTWNTMGRLMGRDGNGSCKTCKEKVLSEATG